MPLRGIAAPVDASRLNSPVYPKLGPTPITLVECLAAVAARAEHELRAHSSSVPTQLEVENVHCSSECARRGSYPANSTATLLSIRAGLAAAVLRQFSLSTWRPTATRLPTLVKVCIAHHLDLWDRMILARVNCAFRRALLSEPTLWNRVSIPRRYGVSAERYWGCLESLISRACSPLIPLPRPIHIKFAGFQDPRPEAANEHNTPSGLIHIASTAVFLSLPVWSVLGDHPEWWQQESVLWRLMCQEAPSLERLSLRVSPLPDDGPMATLPHDFLGQKPGRLQSLYLERVLLQDQMVYPAFRGLREFNYNSEVVKTVIGSNLLQHTLDGMPQLELLGLATITFVIDSPEPTARHDCLREVVVERVVHGLEDLTRFFIDIKKVRYHHCPTADMTLYDQWPDGDLGLVMRSDHVLIRPDTTDPAYIFSVWQHLEWTGEGRKVISIYIASSHAWRIVSLSMKDEEWDAARRLPPLPRLGSLTIIISTCYSKQLTLREVWWGGIIQQGEAPPWRAALGNLQEVRLYSSAQYTSSKSSPSFLGDSQWPPPCTHVCCRDEGCLIFLRDVSDFVRSLHLPGGRRLPRLSLYGFNSLADIEPGLELCELLKLVDEVEGGGKPVHDELLASGETMRDPFSDTRFAREIRDIFDGMSLVNERFMYR